MKKLSLKIALTALIGFFSLFSTSIFSQDSPHFEWATKAGGNYSDEGYSITVDNQGNSYITGYFQNTAIFGSTTFTSNGYYDIFIAKLDANGNYLWAKKAGGNSEDVGSSIAVDSQGNSYVTGYFNNTATFGNTTLTSSGSRDVFITKLDANGNFLWAKQAGGINQYDEGISIAVDSQSNSYITGYFGDTATFGSTTLTSNGYYDMFIAKLDANGNYLWAKSAGESSLDFGFSIAVDNQGNSYVTGRFRGSVAFGSTTLATYGSLQIFITKLDTNGNFLWAKQAGDWNGNATGCSIAVDNQGNVFVSGYFSFLATFGSTTFTSNNSNDDIFITKLDANGNFLWAKQAGGNNLENGKGIAVDSQGNSYLAGYFEDIAAFGSATLTSNGNQDIYITKLDPNGNFIWIKQAGGSYKDICRGIAVDNQGNSYVTGVIQDTVTFGSTTLTGNGSLNIFVAKINNSPLSVPTFESFTNILIYPNPATQQITVESSNALKVIELQDMSGRLITKKNVAGEKTNINVSNLNKGVYFVKVVDNQNKVKVVKVAKE